MDVINFISKVPGLPDAEVVRHDQPWQPGEKYFACGPRLHEYLKDLGAILKQYDAFSVGEMPFVYDPREIINAVGYHRGELNMIFSFEHVDVDHGKLGKFSPREWKLRELKDVTKKWQSFMLKNDGWNALYLENHDQPRSITRFASDSASPFNTLVQEYQLTCVTARVPCSLLHPPRHIPGPPIWHSFHLPRPRTRHD